MNQPNNTRKQQQPQKARRKQSKANKKNSRSSRAPQRQVSIRLSPCAIAYARSQFDPFSAGLRESLPCIPDDRATTSFKFSTLIRGNVFVGAANTGYLVVCPYTFGSDSAVAWSTTSTYAATAVPTATGATVVELKDTHFPWLTASLPALRVVGCGVRVRYVGTELNRGGTAVKLVGGDNTDFAGLTYAALTSLPEARIEPINRQWHTIAYRSVNYVKSDFTSVGSANVTNASPMVICVTGSPSNMFEVEIIRYFEAISSSSTAVLGVSKSDSDSVGMSIVRDFASSVLASDAGQAVLNGFSSYLKNSAAHAMSGLALGAASTAIPALGWAR